MKSFYHLLILTTISVIHTSSSRCSQCYYSRLSEYPCKPRNEQITIPKPEANEWGIYSTRIKCTNSNVRCILRKRGHIIQPIQSIATDDLKLIHSPGYEYQPRKKYLNNMLVEYNISCGTNKHAFFFVYDMDLEPKNCYVPSLERKECQDYILVITKNGGNKEFCGSDISQANIFLPSGSAHIIMRTSQTRRHYGFAGYVVCFPRHPATRLSKCTGVAAQDIYATKFQLKKLNSQSYTSLQDSEELIESTVLDNPSSHNVVPKLTVSEKHALDAIAKEYIPDRLREAQQLNPVWPPPEFLEDIDDLVETPSTQPLIPSSDLQHDRDEILPAEHLRPIQKRLTNVQAKRAAVAYQDACNPILRSAAKSSVSYARRNAPMELQLAENQLLVDQDILPQNQEFQQA